MADGLSGQVYDENGYLQKVQRSIEGPQGNMTITTTYKWENGKVKSQSMDSLACTHGLGINIVAAFLLALCVFVIFKIHSDLF